MFTGKQERNGATGTTATQMSAMPGPDYTAEVAALFASATSISGYQMPIVTPDMTVVDWETGFAGHEISHMEA